MATIYRFIVETKTQAANQGRKSAERDSGFSTKSVAKKGKYVTLLSSAKGGVEHNRKLRAINPLLNKATSGYWEKSMRLGRAGLGLVKFDAATGAFAGLSATAIAIIVSFIIQAVMKWHNKEIQIAENYNKANFKALETGQSAIRGAYEISVNQWDGRVTYNQNK